MPWACFAAFLGPAPPWARAGSARAAVRRAPILIGGVRHRALCAQGIGSDLLVLPPGLPRNMAIVPRVPEIAVTASRTVEHALAMRALATRASVRAFRLVRSARCGPHPACCGSRPACPHVSVPRAAHGSA